MKMNGKIHIILIACIVLVFLLSVIALYPVCQSTLEYSRIKQTIQNELTQYEDGINDVNSEISSIQAKIKGIRNRLNETHDEIVLRQSDGEYILHDPTYSEVMTFIRDDKTERKTYVEDTFTCTHYSLAVNNNSEKNGIRCAIVTVKLSGGEGHALVAFNTTDKGLLFIEPQSDEKVNLEIGEDYWADCVVVKSSRYYYEPDSDNIVTNYYLSW